MVDVAAYPRIKVKCLIEDCYTNAFCRGYCRICYLRLYRKGLVHKKYTKREQFAEAPREFAQGSVNERLRALEGELKKAEETYNNAVGFECRMKWRRKMEEIQHVINKLKESE